MPRWCYTCNGPLDIYETRQCAACIAKNLEPESEDIVCPACGFSWHEGDSDG